MARKKGPQERGTGLVLYAVVDFEGNLKVNRKRGNIRWAVYTNLAWAKRGCTEDGDSVCETIVDLSKAPLYILKKG